MRGLRKLWGSLLLLMLLSGCWNSHDIQRLAYVTTIGLDYKNDEYITYIQVLNFLNIAKSEVAEVGKLVPIWVGVGKGKTIAEALTSLYATSQYPLYWGHVQEIVLTEAMLKHGIAESYDTLNRYREIRYNILLYGTKEPLEDILIQKSILNFSPLDSMLALPEKAYNQRSVIRPTTGVKFISQMYEPGFQAILPSITLNSEVWKEDKKPKSMFQINGAYYFNHDNPQGWMPEADMLGTRWLQKKMKHTPLNIPDSENPEAALELYNPKVRIRTAIHNGEPRFRIKLHLKANVTGLVYATDTDEMEKMAAEAVKREMLHSFEKGLEQKIDVFQLQGKFYRKHPKLYKKLSKEKDFLLDKDSLEDIDVRVQIIHTGTYKNRLH